MEVYWMYGSLFPKFWSNNSKFQVIVSVEILRSLVETSFRELEP